MVLPLPVNAPAELSEWVATLGQHWDEQQRVRFLGMHSGSGQATLRILASSATGQVRVHQQVSATYGAADHTEDIDCRPNRQQQVTLDIVDGQYVWLIPLWDDQGTLRAFDGVTGPDQMTLVDLLTLDGAGSGLDADLLDGEEGLFYQDASNLISGVLADARLSANVALLDAVLNTFTGDMTVEGDLIGMTDIIVYEPGGRSSLNMDFDVGANGSVKYRHHPSKETLWELLVEATDDDGDNDGADFKFRAFDDAGSHLSFPLTIERASGLVTLTGGLVATHPSDIQILTPVGNAPGADSDFPQVLRIGKSGTGPYLVAYQISADSDQQGLRFYTHPDGDFAAAAELALTLSATATSPPDAAFPGNIFIAGDGVGGRNIRLGGTAGSNRGLQWRDDDPVGGNLRWFMYTDLVAEGGSNAGSDFRISRYSDAGSFLDDALRIVRSDGEFIIGGDVQFEASLSQQWNIIHDVMIKMRGATSNPGSGSEWGAKIGFGAGLNPPYIAGIQLGGDPDTAGLVFHTHSSGTSADPTHKTLQLGPGNPGRATFYGDIAGNGGSLQVTGSLVITNTLTVNNDMFVLDVFNAQGRANIAGSGEILHFFQDAGGGATKQTVTGASNTDKINNLLAALDAYGLIVDGT